MYAFAVPTPTPTPTSLQRLQQQQQQLCNCHADIYSNGATFADGETYTNSATSSYSSAAPVAFVNEKEAHCSPRP